VKGSFALESNSEFDLWKSIAGGAHPLKERVNTLMNGATAFEPAEGNASARVLLIYHPSIEHGKISIGWISTFECPKKVSVGAAIRGAWRAALLCSQGRSQAQSCTEVS
jgi:hypothetical protein